MAGSKRTYAQHVYVVFHSLFGSLFGRLEERTHIHVITAVGIAGSAHFGAAVVAVLTHFGNHNTWATTFPFLEEVRQALGFLEVSVIFGSCFIHA